MLLRLLMQCLCNTTRCRTNTCGVQKCAKTAIQFSTTVVRQGAYNSPMCSFPTTGFAVKPRVEEEEFETMMFDIAEFDEEMQEAFDNLDDEMAKVFDDFGDNQFMI